jgi:hypothetical protein
MHALMDPLPLYGFANPGRLGQSPGHPKPDPHPVPPPPIGLPTHPEPIPHPPPPERSR